jgi:hypothetical protein
MVTERDHINHLLDTADVGPSNELSTTTPTERNDLYDSDRTVILRKLSNQSLTDEEQSDENKLTVEQMQRRMKAFALTKKMKRVKEERNAMDGIIAIEKERQNQEHFSLNETIDESK